MIKRRGYGTPINPKYGTDNKTDTGYKYHPGYHWIWSEMDIKKKHGTVLASMCFRSYKIPIIQIPSISAASGSKKKRTRKKHARKKR